jgi:hypothetical protein
MVGAARTPPGASASLPPPRAGMGVRERGAGVTNLPSKGERHPTPTAGRLARSAADDRPQDQGVSEYSGCLALGFGGTDIATLSVPVWDGRAPGHMGAGRLPAEKS